MNEHLDFEQQLQHRNLVWHLHFCAKEAEADAVKNIAPPPVP